MEKLQEIELTFIGKEERRSFQIDKDQWECKCKDCSCLACFPRVWTCWNCMCICFSTKVKEVKAEEMNEHKKKKVYKHKEDLNRRMEESNYDEKSLDFDAMSSDITE